MTPEDIELLFQSRRQALTTVAGPHGYETVIPTDENNFRVLKLNEILLDAQHAWASGSEELDLIAEKLGDGSRDASWRVPIGDSGLLDFFLGILHEDSLRQPLKIHALRLIGNSCADTNENRARVVQSRQIPSIVKLFSENSLLPFLIPVVYNVCVDYEPAQLEACIARLSQVLVEIISSPRLLTCRPFLNIICDILELLISQEPEVTLANPATATLLLKLAVSREYPPDLEDYCGLTSVALAYLTHEKFQTHLLAGGHCDLLMLSFEDSYARFNLADADTDEAAQLKQIQAAFLQVISDISASLAFAASPTLDHIVQRLIRWLGDPSLSRPHLHTAACISLGNLARSDKTSIALLQDVYGPLSTRLTSPSSPPTQLLHAVLSFIKNLAIPIPNKPILGRLLLDPPLQSILSRLWSTDQPQTQFAAISLTRLLVSGCPANVRRLCTPLSPDPSSPAHERTNLHLLISITSRADAEPTKLEGARTVAAVCKVLHSTPPSDPQPIFSWGGHGDSNDGAGAGKSDRERFYNAHEAEISKCLADLLTQRRFPALRSETLFAMALMSRSPDGARVVCRALHPLESGRALVEAVTGKDMTDGRDVAGSGEGSEEVVANRGGAELDVVEGLGLEPRQASLDPAQAATMAKTDRENGMVLVAELLRQDEVMFPQFRRTMFEEMLKTGGQMVLSERENAE